MHGDETLSHLHEFWSDAPKNGAFNLVVRRHRWSPALLSKQDRYSLGKLGETITAKWAENCGFNVIARQIRHRGFELDLVTQREFDLRVIEVKTRLNPYKEPDMNVTMSWLNIKKKAALYRGVDFILNKMGSEAQKLRSVSFDLVVVDIRNREQSLLVYRWPNVMA